MRGLTCLLQQQKKLTAYPSGFTNGTRTISSSLKSSVMFVSTPYSETNLYAVYIQTAPEIHSPRYRRITNRGICNLFTAKAKFSAHNS